MQFIKNSFGVKVFLFCWILVLLIPNWREFAIKQWDTDHLDVYISGIWPDFGLSPEELKKSDDWRLRLESIQQQYISTPQVVKGQGAKRRAREIRNSIKKNDRHIAQYAELSKQFPEENAIRQAWILKGTSGGLKVESSPPKGISVFENRIPYSKATLESLVQCTIDGQKVDPKNSFYPLMRSVFLFTLRRDKDAIIALHQAGNCEFFEDGVRETVSRRIELRSRVQQPNWFSKNAEMWSVLLPHLSSIRAAGRQTMTIAKERVEKGDKQGALQLVYDLQRVCDTFLVGKQFTITPLVGQDTLYYAWFKTMENVGKVKPSDIHYYSGKREDRAKIVRIFAQYARDMGQGKIADSALMAASTFQKFDGQYLNSPAFKPLENATLLLNTCFWLQSKLLKMAMIGCICWLISVIFTRKLEYRTLSQRKILFFVAAFCVGATSVFFTIGIYFYGAGRGSYPLYYSTENESLNSLSKIFDSVLTTTLSVIWLAPIALLTAIQLASILAPHLKGTKEFQIKNVVAGALYTVIIASLICIIQGYNDITGSSIALALWPTQLYTFFLAIFGATVLHLLTSSGKGRISALLFWGAVWMLAAFFYSFSLQNVLITSVCFAVSLVLLISSVWIRGWKTPVNMPDLFPDFMFRVRIFAALMGACASLAYLGCSFATLPPEARMNTALDRQLEIGPMAWIEEQMHPIVKN